MAYKKVSTRNIPASQREEIINQMRLEIPEDSVVFTILRHVSSTGMQRIISPVTINTDKCNDWDMPASLRKGAYPDVRHWSYNVAIILRRSYATGFHDGVVCNGLGMDMGLDLVSNLAYYLHGNENALKQQWL